MSRGRESTGRLFASRRWSRPWVIALALLFVPGGAAAVNPELNAVASALVPGLGQAVNGDYVEGGLQFGASLVLFTNYVRLTEDDRFIEPDDRPDDQNKLIRTNRTTFEADLYGAALVNLTFYSAFGAYRDARLNLNNEGYDTPAPTESLGDLAAAPFNPEFLLRPTTWVPLMSGNM